MDFTKKENIERIKLVSNNIKVLALDAITYAGSGHSGIVLSAADILSVLFQNHLIVDPNNLDMFNKDRFILEAGHGSALLYATMVVFGYNSLGISDLKEFRQLNSLTPGHPEKNVLHGIDYTTGPLGQGSAGAVGFAIAESHLRAFYNSYVNNIIDHYTYCLMSDGGFEEGINYEALSIAGKYKLNKLIFLYDSNDIQLDGKVINNTITNKKEYFESLGLNYIFVADGHDFKQIDDAISLAKKSKEKSTIIEFKTILGKDTEYENTNKIHGIALSIDELNEYKKNIGWKEDFFTLSDKVIEIVKEFKIRGENASLEFDNNLKLLKNKDIGTYNELINSISMKSNFDYKQFEELLNSFTINNNCATRDIASALLQEIFKQNKLFMVANPDISSSTKIKDNNSKDYDFVHLLNNNIQVGVREFVALSIVNGIVAHFGNRAITSTFLCFSDYNKAALRLAAISNLPSVVFYSHDSINVGEDGPTHEPIEQLSSLRLIPNHNVYRPANVYEMLEAFKFAFTNKETPTSIITSRQKFVNYISKNFDDIRYGGYIFDDEINPDLIIIATGSEVCIAVKIKEELKKIGLHAKIISMSSTFIFDKQTNEYKNKVLSLDKKYTFSIELGSTAFWYKYADHPIGIDHFGKSAKSSDLLNDLNWKADIIANKIKDIYINIK